MSDDLSNAFLQSREIDDEIEGDLARLRQAGINEKHKGFLDDVQTGVREALKTATPFGPMPEPVAKWIHNLPKNVTVGVMDAARAGFDLIDDVGEEIDDPQRQAVPKPPPLAAASTGIKVAKWTVQKLKLGEAWDGLRGELARGSSGSDQLTQSAAQFFIPFTGWMKGMKALQVGSKSTFLRGMAADAATMVTSFEPHEARFADLLRLANSDNVLINAYIDTMSADDDEGEWEGRFKNVLDSQVAGLAISSVIMSGVKAFKTARKALKLPEAQEAPDAANP